MSGNDLEQARPEATRRRRRSCRTSLLLLLVLACLTVTVLAVSAVRWQAALRNSGISTLGADPDLNFAQRLYLQNYLANRGDELRQPAGDADDISFVIPAGATADVVVNKLVESDLLNKPELFLNYLRFYGLDSALQTGQFTLNGRLTVPQLAATITKGSARDIVLSFLPGMRLEEIAQYLTVTRPADIDPAEFLALARRQRRFDVDRYPFLNSLPAQASLEGFLYPDTYIVPPNANAIYLLDQMLRKFDQQVTPAMRQAYGAQGLSLLEAVILASIVERETMTEEERPLIASVFLNRVQAGMPLQADPTVQYAVGFQEDKSSWWKVPLSLADLEFEHPFNTYTIPGLPPG
ncbi:MAG: endolytic transglycosylase MltG, partial [Anaerolineaceae bacterium]